jgi:hypothetical protein
MTYRLLFCFLTMLGVGCMLGWFWFGGHDIDIAPRAPDAQHTVAVEEHGGMVFLTPFQDKARWGCLLAMVVFGMAAQWARRRCNFNFRTDELSNSQ